MNPPQDDGRVDSTLNSQPRTVPTGSSDPGSLQSQVGTSTSSKTLFSGNELPLPTQITQIQSQEQRPSVRKRYSQDRFSVHEPDPMVEPPPPRGLTPTPGSKTQASTQPDPLPISAFDYLPLPQQPPTYTQHPPTCTQQSPAYTQQPPMPPLTSNTPPALPAQPPLVPAQPPIMQLQSKFTHHPPVPVQQTVSPCSLFGKGKQPAATEQGLESVQTSLSTNIVELGEVKHPKPYECVPRMSEPIPLSAHYPSKKKVPLPHPAASLLKEHGWLEPVLFQCWRTNPVQPGSFRTRYDVALEMCPRWPDPLPYETWNQFMARLPGVYSNKEVLYMFLWRERHDSSFVSAQERTQSYRIRIQNEPLLAHPEPFQCSQPIVDHGPSASDMKNFHKPPQPHPAANTFQNRGWIEPIIFAYWRGQAMLLHKPDCIERYHEASEKYGTWPAPLPYETWKIFVRRLPNRYGEQQIRDTFEYRRLYDPRLISWEERGRPYSQMTSDEIIEYGSYT